MDRSKNYWQGVRDGIPIFLGYLAVSFSFGILAVKDGLSVGAAALMSALNLTSAGQFAALEVISVAGSCLELAMTQLIINLRYCLMSCALSQKLPQGTPTWKRCLVAFGNTDEVFGLSMAHATPTPAAYTMGLISSAFPGWVLGTLFGAVAGSLLPARLLNALGIMLYGMFIAIVIPDTKKSPALRVVVPVTALVSVAFNFLPGLRDISSGLRIVILTVLLSALAAVIFPHHEDEEAKA